VTGDAEAPHVSVLMPVRNGMPFIRAALDSLLAVNTVPFEILVQDAESDDMTVQYLSDLHDPRVGVVSEPDAGQADALNRALLRASGDWILWLNADDVVETSAFVTIARALKTATADVVYGDFALIDRSGGRLRRYFCPSHIDRRSLLTRGVRIFSGSMFIRRRALIDAGSFDPSFNYCMDYELFVRLADRASFKHVPIMLGSLRLHDRSKSISRPWAFLREARRVQRMYGGSAGVSRSSMAVDNARMAVLLAASPLRYSRLWSRIRKTKRL